MVTDSPARGIIGSVNRNLRCRSRRLRSALAWALAVDNSCWCFTNKQACPHLERQLEACILRCHLLTVRRFCCCLGTLPLCLEGGHEKLRQLLAGRGICHAGVVVLAARRLPDLFPIVAKNKIKDAGSVGHVYAATPPLPVLHVEAVLVAQGLGL